MMHASHRSDHIEADFTADSEMNDYGAPGSPRWQQVKTETIRLVALSVCGVDMQVIGMPKRMSDAIIERLTDGIEWEDE